MEVRNIYCILDLGEIKKDLVVKDLEQDGYKHNFLFGNTGTLELEDKVEYINQSDEVWCFGDCSDTEDLMLARELGKDIWQMG